MKPLTIKWKIPQIEKNAQSSIYNYHENIRARLMFFPPKNSNPVYMGIKFMGIGQQQLQCDYSLTVSANDQDSSLVSKGSKMISVANTGVKFSVGIDENNIQNFLINGSLYVECTFVCESKKSIYGPPKRRTQRHLTSNDVSYTLDSNPSEANIYTGYVGLKNQGATCYMNSYLQALFHLPAFRRIIYNIPTTGTEDLTKSIPINLQILFYYMQFSKEPVSTADLTKSFGWDNYESHLQQDVQEFSRVLIDNLERKMKGTDLEESIANLFKGRVKRYIYCPEVNFKTEKEETFYDLSLDINNYTSLEESFDSLTVPEKLDGKYDTGDERYGKQDAEMGIEFIDLPPVLFLHLKRFQYDQHYRIIKVNKKLSFPQELNLEHLLKGDKKYSPVYELTGVLVHSGSVASGHYYAYLRTTAENKWYQFNDTRVTIEDEKSVIDNNFGSDTHTTHGYSAYYLIYARKDDISNLYRPVADDEVPEHIKNYVKMLEEQKRLEKEEQQEKSKHIKLNITKENDLVSICADCKFGFGVFQSYSQNQNDANENELKDENIVQIEVLKSMTFEELYKQIGEKLGLEPDTFRIWRNCAFNIPNVQIPLQQDHTLQTISGTYTKEMNIFVQKKPKEETTNLTTTQRVIYIKFFFPEQKIIQFIGSLCVNEEETLQDVSKRVNKLVNFPEETILLAFQETTVHSAKKLIMEDSIANELIENGSILIFQQPPSEPQLKPSIPLIEMKLPPKAEISAFDLLPDLRTGFVSAFIEEYFLQHTCAFYDYNEPEKELCKFTFPLSITFDALKVVLAKAGKLNYDPHTTGMMLFLRDSFTFSGPANNPIDTNGRPIQVFDKATTIIYVKLVANIPDAEVKKMNLYHVLFSNNALTIDFDESILEKKKATPLDLLENMRKNHPEIPKIGPFRVYEIIGSQFGSRLEVDKEIKFGYIPIRIEKIPEEQKEFEIYQTKALQSNLSSDCQDQNLFDVKCIPCYKCFIDEYMNFRYVGVPFMFSVYKNEKFVDTKKRIQEICGETIPPDALIEVKDGSVQIEDEDILYDKVSSNGIIRIHVKSVDENQKKIKDHSSIPCCCSDHFRRNVGVKIYN